MRNSVRDTLLVAVGLLAVTTSLYAHHGNASYDNDKKVTVAGTVTEWIWANPHCWLKFDAKDDKGVVQHWIVEASNPPDMTRQGWTKTSFKPGDAVSILMIQAKNGGPIGRFSGANSVTLNGQPFPPGSGNTQAASKP